MTFTKHITVGNSILTLQLASCSVSSRTCFLTSLQRLSRADIGPRFTLVSGEFFCFCITDIFLFYFQISHPPPPRFLLAFSFGHKIAPQIFLPTIFHVISLVFHTGKIPQGFGLFVFAIFFWFFFFCCFVFVFYGCGGGSTLSSFFDSQVSI